MPGVNITQVSARDINVTAAGATGTLATGQLALLDGRSLYQDFFGFVMWDFLPVNLNEIKQVEVIRGPASAVWGANALNGVVNVITQVAARDAGDERSTLGVGGFDRVRRNDSAEGAGTLFYISGTHAQAVNDRWRLSRSRPAATRRIRCRGRPAPSRATCPRSARRPKNPYPPLHQPGDDAAEVRRARRLRLRRTARS